MSVDMKDYLAYQEGYEAGKRDAAAAIEALQAQLPKRDEIVRCGECKHQRPEALKGSVYCRKHRFVKSADWFCADGEREVQE